MNLISMLQNAIDMAVYRVYDLDLSSEVVFKGDTMCDYASNIALRICGKVNKKPVEVAEELVKELAAKNEDLGRFFIGGAGFINVVIDSAIIVDALTKKSTKKTMQNQKVIVEYSDPNPLKMLHVGHLYDGIVGESIAKLNEEAGAMVTRVNFGGDVGLHVAKVLYGFSKQYNNLESIMQIPEDQRIEIISQKYVEGNKAYEDDEAAKAEIREINKEVYRYHREGDHQTDLAQVYWTLRMWSYQYFDKFYAMIGTHFDKYYPESQTADVGMAAVLTGLDEGIFKKSEGAIVYDGYLDGSHTRVFVNSEGLPTYETKDIGLALLKWQDFPFDQNIIITGNDILEYMKVLLSALSKIEPKVAERTTHITHGMVKLTGGVKMSSRLGNGLGAESVIEMTKEALAEAQGVPVDSVDPKVVLAAIKYAFLKSRIEGDVIYDPAQSVSLVGNSGVYLLYTFVRVNSILQKSKLKPAKNLELIEDERRLGLVMAQYGRVYAESLKALRPHLMANYAYDLASAFNSFYENCRILDDPRELERITLLKEFQTVLTKTLNLLNIDPVDSM